MDPAVLAVAHAIPGRLRLHLPSTANTDGLVDLIRGRDGVTACTWNPRTRSLLIRYRPDETDPGALLEAIANHVGVPAPDEVDDTNVRKETVAGAVTSAVSQLNGRVARATGGRLGLGVLVPLALAAWAVRELLFRARIAPLSWSSALWYAHGLFRDYALRERS